jgi:hypothetical protein
MTHLLNFSFSSPIHIPCHRIIECVEKVAS